MKIRILRQKATDSEPYWESFNYDGTMEISVAGMLDKLNFGDDIINDLGEKTDRIGWESSCLQGMCGACAMAFYGAVYANDCYLVNARNRKKSRDIHRSYAEHFARSCSKALSCIDICPMHIPTLSSMGKMNRVFR